MEKEKKIQSSRIPKELDLLSIYQFQATTISGKNISLDEYEGKVLLIVNTASKCGFTPQYKELQELFEKYKDQNFTILGFPCNQFNQQEPGTHEEIQEFCKLNYGVTFPMFAKVDVKGKHIHPLFDYLTRETKGLITDTIKWNFTKFLIGINGKVVKRYSPTVKPSHIEKDIIPLLNKP